MARWFHPTYDIAIVSPAKAQFKYHGLQGVEWYMLCIFPYCAYVHVEIVYASAKRYTAIGRVIVSRFTWQGGAFSHCFHVANTHILIYLCIDLPALFLPRVRAHALARSRVVRSARTRTSFFAAQRFAIQNTSPNPVTLPCRAWSALHSCVRPVTLGVWLF